LPPPPQNKEVIALHQRIVEEPAFKAGVALGNRRRGHPFAGFRGKPEGSEFVHRVAVTVTDSGDRLRHGGIRQIDNALPAAADHVETDIAGGNHAPDQRGGKLQHRIPAKGHDIIPILPATAD
jgi:hypothetical protein